MASAVVSGSTAEFNDFYEDEFASVALVAGATAGRWAIGEEIAEEALMEAYGRWEDISILERPGAWIRRVAINLAIDRRRRLIREDRAVARLDIKVATDETDPNEHVWKAIASLPPKQRAAVVMHYHDGWSTADIADALDSTVSAVTSSLHTARANLAKQLEDST